EAEVRRLERKAAKLRTSPGSRHGKRRLLELTRAIAEKRAAIVDHLTTRELAKATGRSRRWITGRARSIPGARRARNKLVFEKSNGRRDGLSTGRSGGAAARLCPPCLPTDSRVCCPFFSG